MSNKCNHPSGILTVDAPVQRDQLDEFRRQLDERPSGRVIVVNGFRQAEYRVIECSHCENPAAVRNRILAANMAAAKADE